MNRGGRCFQVNIIDPHLHVETLNHHHLELMALAGVKSIISMVAVPEVQDNIRAESIFQYCDRVLEFHSWRTNHYFSINTYLCPGLSMVGVPVDFTEGIKKLRTYISQ